MDHAQPKRKSQKNKLATGYENSIATKKNVGQEKWQNGVQASEKSRHAEQ